MNLARARDAGTLTPLAKTIGQPILVLGLALDAVTNWTLFSVLFLDFPREFLITDHLKRLVAGKEGWRKRAAIRLCRELLNPFDPKGCHCGCQDEPWEGA